MYLLSIDGMVAKRILESVRTLPSRWQTVYRWGMNWGYLIPDVGEPSWKAERHEYVTHIRDTDDTTYLIERIEPSTIGSPPFIIDDVWKEEIKMDGICSYGNLLTIRGTKATLESILKKLSISFALPESMHTETTTCSEIEPSSVPRLEQRQLLPEQRHQATREHHSEHRQERIHSRDHGGRRESGTSYRPGGPRMHGQLPQSGGRHAQGQLPKLSYSKTPL